MITPQDVHKRLLQDLKPYVSDPPDFLRLLDKERSVIAGIFALNVLFDLRIPGDLTVYVPYEGHRQFRQVFATNGYTLEVRESWNREASPAKAVRGISASEKWSNEQTGLTICLSASFNEAATYPVFCDMFSHLMNYCTGHSFYVAYPAATTSKYMMFSSSYFRNRYCPVPSIELQKRINFFEQHGFLHRLTSKQWQYDGHECRTTPDCPHTVRRENDFGGFKADFCPEHYEQPRPVCSIVWSLGGYACESNPESEGMKQCIRTLMYVDQ